MMKLTTQHKLRRILKTQSQVTGAPCIGLSESGLTALRLNSLQVLNTEPPAFYLDLLQVSNGLFWDDLQLYYALDLNASEPGTRTLCEERELLCNNLEARGRGLPKMLFVFGENDLGLFCYHTQTPAYFVFDPFTFEQLEDFGTFDALLDWAIKPFEEALLT